jgi:hypothetical protein
MTHTREGRAPRTRRLALSVSCSRGAILESLGCQVTTFDTYRAFGVLPTTTDDGKVCLGGAQCPPGHSHQPAQAVLTLPSKNQPSPASRPHARSPRTARRPPRVGPARSHQQFSQEDLIRSARQPFWIPALATLSWTPSNLDCSVTEAPGTTCRCEDGTLGPDPLTHGGAVLKETRPTSHSAGEDTNPVMDTCAGTAVRARSPGRR